MNIFPEKTEEIWKEKIFTIRTINSTFFDLRVKAQEFGSEECESVNPTSNRLNPIIKSKRTSSYLSSLSKQNHKSIQILEILPINLNY